MIRFIVLLAFIPVLLLSQVEFSHQGFGLDIGSKGSGFFYNRMYSNLTNSVNFIGEFRFYDIKGPDETIVFNNYSGQQYTVGGQNLILLPSFIGVNFHPFINKIENNFSPFISIRSGPIFAIDGKENANSFKDKWSNTKNHWSIGGFFGGGLEFRWLNSTSISILFGFDYLPLSKFADGSKDYSGILLHVAFNKIKN